MEIARSFKTCKIKNTLDVFSLNSWHTIIIPRGNASNFKVCSKQEKTQFSRSLQAGQKYPSMSCFAVVVLTPWMLSSPDLLLNNPDPKLRIGDKSAEANITHWLDGQRSDNQQKNSAKQQLYPQGWLPSQFPRCRSHRFKQFFKCMQHHTEFPHFEMSPSSEEKEIHID